MTLSAFLTITLGLTASALFIASNYIINRKWIIIIQGLGSLSVGLMFVTRAIAEDVPSFWGPAIINFILLSRSIYTYFREKYLSKNNLNPAHENVKTGLFFGFLAVSAYFVVTEIPAEINYLTLAIFILPLTATVGNVLAIAQSKVLTLKWFILLSVSSWLAFDILVGAWPTLIGDTFSAIATGIAILRLTVTKPKTLAILSFILSFLGIGLIGVLIGYDALKLYKNEAVKGGKAFAQLGVIIGFFTLAISIIFGIIYTFELLSITGLL